MNMLIYFGFLIFCFLANKIVISTPICFGEQIHISESNWTVILQGEWMVKFYAPWCPACSSIKPTWKSLAENSHLKGFCVASADVTENAGLSGRFFITSLPTIYHVKDGEFRLFSGERSQRRMGEFAGEDGDWRSIEAVPWYTAPTSGLMSFLGWFFRFSALLKDAHTTMTDDYHLPSWVAYLIFAIATILAGLFVGLCIVCICDFSSTRGGQMKREALHKKDDDRFKGMDVIEEQISNSEVDEEEEEEAEETEDGGGDKKDK